MINRTYQNDFKARTIKIIILLMFTISLLPLVSSFEFDNSLSPGENGKAGYPDITIRNAFGLGRTLWTGTLESNTPTCSSDCEAIKTITIPETGSLIDDIQFKTLQADNSWVEQSIRSYQFYLRTNQGAYEVDDYESQCTDNLTGDGTCEQVKTGSHTEYLAEWIPYQIGTEMSAGTYEIKLDGKKKPSRTVDWVIKSQGVWIEEWAIWGNISEGDEAEIVLNSPEDNFVSPINTITFNATGNVTGGALLINMSLYHNGTGTWQLNQTNIIGGTEDSGQILVGAASVTNKRGVRINMKASSKITVVSKGTASGATTCYVANSTSPFTVIDSGTYVGNDCAVNATVISGEVYFVTNDAGGGAYDRLNNDTNGGEFTGTLMDWDRSVETNSVGPNAIQEIQTITFGGAVESTQIFTTPITGPTLWGIQACDTDGDCGFSENRTVRLDTTSPIVSLISPSGDVGSFVSGINLTLNWTLIETNPDTCWYDYGGVNTTVSCTGQPQNLTVTDPTELSLIFYANDTIGNVGSDSTTWSYSFVEGNVSFNENSTETDSEFFQINLTTGVNVLSIDARLDYNGTEYSSTATCSGPNCTLSNTIDLPLVTTGESQINSFFWNFTIFDGTSETQIITSSRDQNVSRIHIEECGGSFTVEALNFTSEDETESTRIDPFYFAGDFNIWLGSGDIKRNNSFSQLSTDEEILCIFPPDRDFTVGAIIEYNEVVNSSIYDTRNYFFQEDIINNQSQQIPLFLLKSDDSTSFILKVQDTNLLAVSNAIIIIERFNPGTGSFTTVAIAKTDDTGQTVGFFKTETVDYRFTIKKNGIQLLQTVAGKVVPESAPFTLTFTVGADLGSPWAAFEDLTGLTQTLVFDTDSGNVTFTYIDSNTTFVLGRLELRRNNPSNTTNSPICVTNSTLSSATLVCGTENVGGSYTASAYITRGSETTLVSQIIFQVESFSSVAGLLGVFLAWFIILVAAFAFKFNEIAGIVLVNLTVIMVNLIGLVNFGMLFIFGLMGVSLIIIVMLKK